MTKKEHEELKLDLRQRAGYRADGSDLCHQLME
jgi:hypothetical protein